MRFLICFLNLRSSIGNHIIGRQSFVNSHFRRQNFVDNFLSKVEFVDVTIYRQNFVETISSTGIFPKIFGYVRQRQVVFFLLLLYRVREELEQLPC